jgi:hypothetical protein
MSPIPRVFVAKNKRREAVSLARRLFSKGERFSGRILPQCECKGSSINSANLLAQTGAQVHSWKNAMAGRQQQ